MLPRILLNRALSFTDFVISHRKETNWTIPTHIEHAIDADWDREAAEYTKNGVLVWDGDPYRVENLSALSKNPKTEQIHIEIAPIKYRHLHGFRDYQNEMLANERSWPNHLSVGGPLRTSDGWYVMGERSGKTVATHLYDFIGGGLNEDELEVTSGDDIKTVHFAELLEEANVRQSDVANTRGLGIVQGASTAVLVMFLTQLNITKEQLGEQFQHRSDPEMADLVFVKDAEFPGFLRELGSYHSLLPELLARVPGPS